MDARTTAILLKRGEKRRRRLAIEIHRQEREHLRRVSERRRNKLHPRRPRHDVVGSVMALLAAVVTVDVEVKILNELESIRRESGKSIGDVYSYEELRRMHYLQAAISEGMRLYPPVPIDTRNCKNDDVLPDGTLIGKDWFISYSAYAMGRMESI